MKKLIITTVCTLGLTLMGTLGSYQNTLNLDYLMNSKTGSTEVVENVTNINSNTSLTSDNSIEAANNVAKVTDTTTDKVTPDKPDLTENEKKAEAKVLGATVIKTTNVKKLTYKNVDLSKCKSTSEVVKVLRKNGYTKITTKNIYKNKSLKKLLAIIKAKNADSIITKAPTKAPIITTKPTAIPAPTKAPVITTKPTPVPTKAPVITTKPTPAPTKAPVESTKPSTGVSNYASEVLRLVNVERTKAGLSTLTTTTSLTNAANKRAQETVQSFSHTRPNGTSFSTALAEYGVSYKAAGENIAYGQRTPQEVVTGWMNSPGHRANILNSSFNKIGIGVYQKNGVIYWSQLFTN